MHTKFSSESLVRINHFGGLNVGRIMFRWILEKQDMRIFAVIN